MTKGLPTASFEEFRSSLCVGSGDASTVGGVEYILYGTYVSYIFTLGPLLSCLFEDVVAPPCNLYICVPIHLINTSCITSSLQGGR
jgi:hypothetical protein